ncbi:hypothetical protein Golomagni_02693 [Golovinomyces magnicellulatus]|nr:hypothetical protein Golomagni_02693 [Golovinomyces magnicellulatus]
MREIIDSREQAMEHQIEEFNENFSARFPSHIVDYSEEKVQNDIKAFAQNNSEPLMAYHHRAINLLRRAHGRDNHRTGTSTKSLALMEQVVLNSIISAFVEGLDDDNLRTEVLSRSILSCGSLWRSIEIFKDAQHSMSAMSQVRERMIEKQEIEQIRELCASHFGNPVTSVLAELSTGNLALLRSAICIKTIRVNRIINMSHHVLKMPEKP